MLRIVWDACSTVCRTASAKLSGDRPDSSMNFTTAIVPSLIVRAGYGLPEIAGMQLGAGVVRAQRHLGSGRNLPHSSQLIACRPLSAPTWPATCFQSALRGASFFAGK